VLLTLASNYLFHVEHYHIPKTTKTKLHLLFILSSKGVPRETTCNHNTLLITFIHAGKQVFQTSFLNAIS